MHFTLLKEKNNLFIPNHIKFSSVQMKENTKTLIILSDWQGAPNSLFLSYRV